MLLEWFWRSQSERKGDPEAGFSFPGGSLRGGQCFVVLAFVFLVRWPRGRNGQLPTPACPWTMHGGRWLWGLGGCREGSWRARLGFFGRSAGAGAALMNPLYFFFSPLSSFCADAGERTRCPGKGEAAPACLLATIPPGKPRWVTSPQRDARLPWGCHCFSVWEAQTCAGLSTRD